VPLGDEPLSRLRLRTGRELAVVDVSDSGALVEGSVRLLPGTHLDVHVMTRNGRLLVRSRVARCYIARLKADVVCYHGALAFERPVDTAAAGYLVPEVTHAAMAMKGSDYPCDREVVAD
jgi:hypothetical protein